MSALGAATITNLLEAAPVSSGLPRRRRSIEPAPPTPSPADQVVRVRVRWDDLTHVRADMHVVGHYQNVLPATAERALDEAISTHRQALGDTLQRGIIAEHTRRRWLVGELGEVAYFPGIDPSENGGVAVRRVAIAGMGPLGTFTEARAEQLYASLLRELSALPYVNHIAMVLIGSGAGNLSVGQATRALVSGLSAVAASARPDGAPIEVTVVEVDRLRAEQLCVALQKLEPELSARIGVASRVQHGDHGQVGVDSAAVFAIRALAQAVRHKNGAARRGRAKNLLTELTAALPAELSDRIPAELAKIPDDLDSLAVVLGRPVSDQASPPTRIAISHLGDRMRWAALTERATIPEREVPYKPKLVDELVRRLSAPSAADAERLPRMLRKWIVPGDFQPHITGDTPLVVEVDSAASRLPWEFITDRPYDSGEQTLPLALRVPIARQIKTTYARAVTDYEETPGLKALVIADPGPLTKQLPGARAEGLAVAKLLAERGVDVSLFVGHPGSTPPAGARVATELDVLSELYVGRYDIVHFAGHGTLPEADRTELAGWLFSEGILAARELRQLSWAPRLVVANACWTAAEIGAEQHGRDADLRASLTPVLADEFLRVGVAHYIGTSWRIPDEMGPRFAETFYSRLLPRDGMRGEAVGTALCAARQVLFGMGADTATSPETHSAWAAYQHYGDPSDVIDPFEPAVPITPIHEEASPQ